MEVDGNDPTAGFRHASRAALAFLQAQPGPFRIDHAAGAWQPNAAALLGLEDISGISNPLVLSHYDRYYWSLGYRGSPNYNFLGAQFVIADKGRPPADASFVPVFNEDPQVDIYLNTGAQPRLRLVTRALSAAGPEQAFALIHAPGFDPEQSAVIEGGPGLDGVPSPGESNLYYLDYGAERFTVVARTPAPAYLVFSEVWYPGWRAAVDGLPAPVYRANSAFRAVPLAPGEHIVAMWFDPLSWRAGLGVTLATVGLMLGIGVWGWRLTHHRAAGRFRSNTVESGTCAT